MNRLSDAERAVLRRLIDTPGGGISASGVSVEKLVRAGLVVAVKPAFGRIRFGFKVTQSGRAALAGANQ